MYCHIFAIFNLADRHVINYIEYELLKDTLHACVCTDIHLMRNPCKLYCQATNEKTFKEFSAADGTRCKADSLDMCIAGRCVPVGCDRQLESNATLDQCGVCSGNGSSCVERSGTLALKHLGKILSAVISCKVYFIVSIVDRS